MVTLGVSSRSIEVSRGCTQGGVLSSLLWCLAAVDLIARLKEGGVYTQGYADDICLLAVGKFPKMVSGASILYRCSVTRSGCRLIPTKLDLLHS